MIDEQAHGALMISAAATIAKSIALIEKLHQDCLAEHPGTNSDVALDVVCGFVEREMIQKMRAQYGHTGQDMKELTRKFMQQARESYETIQRAVDNGAGRA